MKYIGYSNVSPAIDKISAISNINLKEFVDKWCKSYIQVNINDGNLVEAISDKVTDEQIKEKILNYNSIRFVFCYDFINKKVLYYKSVDYTNMQNMVENVGNNNNDDVAKETALQAAEILDEISKEKTNDFAEFDSHKNTHYNIPLKNLNNGDTVTFDLYEDDGKYGRIYKFVYVGNNSKLNCSKCGLAYTNKCTKLTPCYNGYFVVVKD